MTSNWKNKNWHYFWSKCDFDLRFLLKVKFCEDVSAQKIKLHYIYIYPKLIQGVINDNFKLMEFLKSVGTKSLREM